MEESLGLILKLVEQGKLNAADAESLIEAIGKTQQKANSQPSPAKATPSPSHEADADDNKSHKTSDDKSDAEQTKFPFDLNKPITIELPPIAERIGREMKDLDASQTLNKAKQEVQHLWEKLWGKDVVNVNSEQPQTNDDETHEDENKEKSDPKHDESNNKWEI